MRFYPNEGGRHDSPIPRLHISHTPRLTEDQYGHLVLAVLILAFLAVVGLSIGGILYSEIPAPIAPSLWGPIYSPMM